VHRQRSTWPAPVDRFNWNKEISMRLNQLHEYLGQLLSAGVDPHTVVCIPTDGEFGELSRAERVTGPFREDPAPLLPGPLQSRGTVLVLTSVLDDLYDILNRPEYESDREFPEAPDKAWPHGHWHHDPRRPDGVI
jgi:hypothetical protein